MIAPQETETVINQNSRRFNGYRDIVSHIKTINAQVNAAQQV